MTILQICVKKELILNIFVKESDMRSNGNKVGITWPIVNCDTCKIVDHRSW